MRVDSGFIWYMVKDFLKFSRYLLFIISLIMISVEANPYTPLFALYIIVAGFCFLKPMVTSVIKLKYASYRKQKEAAWEVLKK